MFEPRTHGAEKKRPKKRRGSEDEARFLKSWLERPLLTGAVMPSGKFLAKAMARHVDPRVKGPVIEIGPGTGPVTEALIEHGVPQEQLVLVEFNPDFVELLKRRFPRATIVQGDAYALKDTLAGKMSDPAAAVVSSLPLLTKPPLVRLGLLKQAFGLMKPGAPFVQFTYAVAPPIPERGVGYFSTASNWILLNVPPARVWVYRES